MNREAPEFDRVFGAALVDKYFVPLGLMLAYFEDDGTISVHAHFGKWLKQYPKDILRHVQKFMNVLRDQGHYIVYAIADESVEGSDVLIRWFNGEDTGKKHEFGAVYKIDLRNTRI